jgi:hypothetical protein
MEMFLMACCLSVFGLGVACAAFGAATRPEGELEMQPEMEVAKAAAPGRFFADGAWHPAAPRVPIEALLLQIESHVRLEHAAAESFLAAPTSALLHSRTVSPLVN